MQRSELDIKAVLTYGLGLGLGSKLVLDKSFVTSALISGAVIYGLMQTNLRPYLGLPIVAIYGEGVARY